MPAPSSHEPADPGGVTFTTVVSRNGVVLRTWGEGTPIFLVPGMEGSGESCLHLAVPVVRDLPGYRLVLVDYGAEQHPTFDALVATITALIDTVAGDLPCRIWGQSFGNLLAVSLAGRVQVEQWTFVSPFTRIPNWKMLGGSLSLAVTPDFLYRATARPLGRYLFGPTANAADHPFFDALQSAPVATVRRRSTWLRGRDAESAFANVRGPVHAWLGARDRLVDLDAQRQIFVNLARERPDWHLSMIADSGHVVLPASAAKIACHEISRWLREVAPHA